MNIRFLRDPGPTGGGGTFAALRGDDNGSGPITDLTDNGTPDDPLKAEAYDDAGALKEGYRLNDAGALEKVPDPVEGLNEDGTLQEGYEKDAEGKVVKIAGTEGDDEPGEVTPEKFYEEVEKLTGRAIKVEYPDEIEDPLSPAGVAYRDSVLLEVGAQQLEESIKKGDPRAYAYMTHRANGGTDESFFQTPAAVTLPTIDALKADPDAQAALYRQDLRTKGLDDTTVELVIKTAITNNKLLEQAERIHGEVTTAQAKQNEEIERAYQLREAETTRNMTEMVAAINDGIAKGMRFVVPDANRAEFTAFVKEHVNYDEDSRSFIITNTVSKENLNTTLESLFFQYKKGDLTTIIERAAKTKAAQQFRLGGGANRAPKGTGGGKNTDDTFVSLGSLTRG